MSPTTLHKLAVLGTPIVETCVSPLKIAPTGIQGPLHQKPVIEELPIVPQRR